MLQYGRRTSLVIYLKDSDIVLTTLQRTTVGGAVVRPGREIEEPPVGMQLNWPRELPGPDIVGIRKRLKNMRWFWFYSAVENGEHTQLVHPFIRDIQP